MLRAFSRRTFYCYFGSKDDLLQHIYGQVITTVMAADWVHLKMLHGRTTLVLGKDAGQWKIVSCHFSPLPGAHN